MTKNYLLRMLLEAADDEKDDAAPAKEEEEAADDTAAEEGADDNAGDNEETTNKDEDTTEDDQENTEEENKDENPEEEQQDDFSLEDNEEGGDDEPPPDGLVDPDDDGSGDEPEEDAETNVHVNILQLSKLDRVLAKKKLFNDFQELRTSINTTRNVVDANETVIDPEVRNYMYGNLDELQSSLTQYLKYKFGYSNYEENFQNYTIFMKELSVLVDYLKNGGEAPKKTKKSKKKQDE